MSGAHTNSTVIADANCIGDIITQIASYGRLITGITFHGKTPFYLWKLVTMQPVWIQTKNSFH
jgi:hypothetical protein